MPVYSVGKKGISGTVTMMFPDDQAFHRFCKKYHFYGWKGKKNKDPNKVGKKRYNWR